MLGTGTLNGIRWGCGHVRSLAVSWLAACLLLALAVPHAVAQGVTVQAVTEAQDCFVGDSFVFQIQVSGIDTAAAPDIKGLNDFQVEELGGQKNNNTSMTIINGRVTRNESRGFTFSYRLTPKRPGTLTIPSVEVVAGGNRLRTRPLAITARQPTESPQFKLRLELSKATCYFGEPVVLSVTWYIGEEPRAVEFNIPVLSSPDFAVIEPDLDFDRGRQYVKLPLAGREVIAEQGSAQMDGRAFTTLTFQRFLTPKTTGELSIPQATVACTVLAGRRQTRPGSPRNPFFDDFFGQTRQGDYRRVVAPSNALTLKVLPLPEQGRPSNFAGHVGEYTIETAATPTEMNVGDPITLTVTVRGPEYLKDVSLPPLDRQPALAQNFKIPKEMAEGKVDGKRKVFVQTIRPLHVEVREIPAIELPYFDTKTGKYSVARSAPIPVTVHRAKQVTALDAEGLGPVTSNGKELERWGRGIAYNYEDLGLLLDQRAGPEVWVKSPVWLALLAAPPLIYLALLLAAASVRYRRADPDAAKARRAQPALVRSLGEVRRKLSEPQAQPHTAILDAIKDYLGAKLRMAPGALTFADVEPELARRGVPAAELAALKDLFFHCEAGRYAGGAGASDPGRLIDAALVFAKAAERVL